MLIKCEMLRLHKQKLLLLVGLIMTLVVMILRA